MLQERLVENTHVDKLLRYDTLYYWRKFRAWFLMTFILKRSLMIRYLDCFFLVNIVLNSWVHRQNDKPKINSPLFSILISR